MATRSSLYGNMLTKMGSSMPNWVFGGEFGDISNLLVGRDTKAEQLQAQELLNEGNQIKLEEQRRQQEMDERMREMDITGGNPDQPPSLRDLYEMKRKVATQYGGVDDVIQVEQELEKLRLQQEQEQRRKELEQRQDEDYQLRRSRGGGEAKAGKPEKTVRMINMEDGVLEDVPLSEAVQKQKSRSHIRLDDPRLDDMELPGLGGSAKEEKKAQGGGFFDGLFGRSNKPGEEQARQQKELVEQIKAEAPATGRPTRAPRPGMKWIRNKKTGELREVPE